MFLEKNWIIRLSGELFEAAVIVLVLYYVIFPVRITGDSMLDTLKQGDRVLVSRAAAMLDMYKSGSIVILKYDSGDKTIKIVKRVAALEGDIIESRDGLLYINGNFMEGYLCPDMGDISFTLEEGQVFVLGDNPEESVDSREFGPVQRKDITGLVVMRFYPFDRICLLAC